VERILSCQKAHGVVSISDLCDDDTNNGSSGDSYSYVGYSAQAPQPTSSSPLGVAFPGECINETSLPNWVGYLIRDHGHGHANMIAYDYARRGDTVTGVYTNQVSREFLPAVGRKPGWAAWGASDSIFGMHVFPRT
jgi:hypothetical protein